MRALGVRHEKLLQAAQGKERRQAIAALCQKAASHLQRFQDKTTRSHVRFNSNRTDPAALTQAEEHQMFQLPDRRQMLVLHKEPFGQIESSEVHKASETGQTRRALFSVVAAEFELVQIARSRSQCCFLETTGPSSTSAGRCLCTAESHVSLLQSNYNAKLQET